jgi:Beta-lactamase enzyme family
MNPAPAAVRTIPLEDVPAAYPQLRFAVRFPDGREKAHDAGTRHPLAGTGKLLLAIAVARWAERRPELLEDRLTLTADHRAAARTGTLRALSGDLQLTVDDALALIVGTGDGACVLAVLEHLAGRGIDVPDLARRLVAEAGMHGTELAGLEPDADPEGASWGEGLLGETTPADLCTLLSRLPGRVVGWMGKAFEPAGLASALPGFGPRTIEHHTLAGFELGAPAGAPGYASVLALPAGVGNPPAVAAAYHPARHEDGRRASALEVTAALGTLGLAVVRSGGRTGR